MEKVRNSCGVHHDPLFRSPQSERTRFKENRWRNYDAMLCCLDSP